MTDTIRQQVLEQLIDVMVDAHEDGDPDPMKAAGEKFPGTPVAVLTEAWCEFDRRQTDAWWQQVERTIDGELIRRALISQGKGGAS